MEKNSLTFKMMPADSTLHFQNTFWLWMLFLLLPLAALFFYAQKQREHLLSKMVASRLRASLIGRVSMIKRVLRACLVLLALGFLMIALARPHLGYEEHSVPSHGRDVMIAIDTSRSMLATDISPTRLARAKLFAEDVLELLPGDRVGLIAFAGKAFLQAPMTLDHGAVRDALNELDTTVIPKGGTNIAEAIHLAMTALGKGEGTERALILMTDGEDLDGDAVAAAKEAKEAEIKIFTIGIGSPEGSLIPILNERNERDFVRDESGKPVLSKLDVQRLQEISSVTGGFYEPFGGDAARTVIQKGILPLAGNNSQVQVTRRPIERYEWPLGAALFLLALWWLIDERRRFSGSIALLLLFLFPAVGRTTPGLKEYQQGNYEAALTTFEQQLKKGNDSDKARFDAGAAAYKQGEYKKAVDYFTGAMTSSSSQIQQAATYNLANALVREGETATEGSEKLSNWNGAIQHYDTVLKADPKNQQAKENQAIVKKLIEDFKKQEEQKKKDQKKDPNQEQQDQQKNQQSNNQSQNSNNNQQNNSSQNQQSSNSQKDQQKNADQNQSPSSSQDQQNQKNPSSAQPESTPTASPNLNSGSGASPTPTPAESPSNQAGSENAGKPTPTPGSQQPSGSDRQASPTPAPQAPQASGSEPQNQSQNQSSSNASSGKEKNSSAGNVTPQPTPEEKKQGALSGGEQKSQAATPAEEGSDGTMSKAQAEAVLRSMKDEEQQVQFQQRKESEETTKDW